jgi:hypothetical protein
MTIAGEAARISAWLGRGFREKERLWMNASHRSRLVWSKRFARCIGAAGLVAIVTLPVGLTRMHAQAPAAQSATSAQRTVWYFYRVKWGFQDEFQTLFARNHLPVLKEQMKTGRIVGVKTFVPTYHGDGRADWTFAVAITYKDSAALVGPSGDEEIQRRLYPDRAKFSKEEQRRFEILDAHWDVPLNELDLK